MNKKILSYSLYGLFGLLVTAALAFKIFQPVQVVPRIRLAPGFALTDQNGNTLTMVQNLGEILSDEQINDLVAFLMTLK